MHRGDSASSFRTYTGRYVWPLDFRAEDICLDDIAQSLANQCRFMGHTSRFYSIAQHSVLVSLQAEQAAYELKRTSVFCHERYPEDRKHWCDSRGAGDFMGHTCGYNPRTIARQALLHDASEAYLTDWPRPMKHGGHAIGRIYQEHEAHVQTTIYLHFALPTTEAQLIKAADNILLATEQRDLMGRAQKETDQWQPLDYVITPWTPDEARQRFLARFHDLYAGSDLVGKAAHGC